MKKNYLLFITITLLVTIQAVSQTIQRNVVILEIGTGTWCTYCPGAANAADQLVDEGKAVAVIENHNGDIYANDFSNARNSYYNITGYPTGRFDGILKYEGGASCPSGNVYSGYLPLYEQRINTPSPLNVCFSGSHSGNDYSISILVKKLTNITATDLRLHLVVTESGIAQNWQGCMTDLSFVNRLMVPGAAGTPINFSSGDVVTVPINFSVDPGWVINNCELVAFVQDNSSKEIFNGVMSPMNTIPASMFTLNDFTGSPLNGCTPLPVTFNTVQPPASTISWDFPGGSPSSSGSPNPVVTYESAGIFNVTLKGDNGVCMDQITKSNYVTVNSTPSTPGSPQGNTALCLNPNTENYSISAVTGANTYTWELNPPAAGTLIPGSTSCQVDWDNSWTGTAELRVQGVSSQCGSGPWSPSLVIHVNPLPGQCQAPSGPTELCQDSPDSEYSTSLSPQPTSFYWSITPPEAGNAVQGFQTTQIDWNPSFQGTVILKVKALNGNCEGPYSDPVSITIQSLPSAYTVAGGGAYCGAGGSGSVVELDGSQLDVNYSLLLDGSATGTVVAGTGLPLDFGNQMASGLYTVSATGITTGCIGMMNGGTSVTIDPQAPGKPGDPSGPAHVYTGSTPTNDYTTDGGLYASTYTWEISPAIAGTINGTGTTGSVNWNTQFAGEALIKVQGVNSCGGGIFSDEFPVTVDMNVGLKEERVNTITLSPNPANSFTDLDLSNLQNVTQLSLIHSSGEQVRTIQGSAIQSINRFDVSGLSAGVYFILVQCEQGTYSVRLIVR